MSGDVMVHLDEYPGYWAGSDGHIYSGKLGALRRMKPDTTARGGYCRVGLKVRTADGARVDVRKCVHALISSVFIGPKPDGHDIDHIDFCRTNNRPENLRYLSTKDNARRWSPEHRQRTLSAVKQANTIYSDDLVLAAMWAKLRMGMTVSQAAKYFGLAQTDLSVWCAGKRRPHLLAKLATVEV